MKNLKKVLALVLAVVMAFSLVTIASAAATPKVQDYKDASSIQYTEAVDLFTALGILQGTDGSYNPTANVTREQAAKIICYTLIGATSADALKTSTSSFSDVAADRWSAGAIQYSVVKGIVNGMGDGTFAPEGNVTATQFAKMLLTALGYGKNGEYTGANWEINVISDAQRLGILSLNVDVTAPATRDQIAQYAFNAYTKVGIVAYSKDLGDYVAKTTVVNNNTVALTLALQQSVTSTSAGSPNGVASHKWAKNNVTLNGNVYANSTFKVLSTVMNGKGLFELTTVGKSTYVASLEDGWNVNGDNAIKVYLNGTLLSYDDNFTAAGAYPADYVSTFADGFVAQYLNSDLRALDLGYTSKGGLIMSLIDTNDNGLVDTIQVTLKTVAVLGADSYVNASGLVTVPGVCTNQEKINVIGYDGLKEDDVVLYYRDNTGVYHIEKAKSVTGQITGGSTAYLTFNGGFLMGTGLTGDTVSIATVYANSANYNTDVTVWLDNGGNMVYFDTAVATSKTYAVLVGYDYNDMTGVATAKIVKDDGTAAVYSVAPDATGDSPNQSGPFAMNGSIHGYLVSYTVNSDGKITLKKVTDSDTLNGQYTAKSNAIAADNVTGGTYYITSTTKVFYFDTSVAYDATTNKVGVTTGYTTTATAADGTAITPVLVTDTQNVLKAVLVQATGAVNTSNKYAFVPSAFGTGASVSYSGTTPTYTYSVYVDGAVVQLQSSDGTLFAAGQGLYKYTLAANGKVVSTNPVDSRIVKTAGDADTKTVDTGYIVLDNGDVIFTDENTKFYLFTEGFLTASVTASTLKEGNAFVHYTVKYWVTDSTDPTVADAVYFTYTVS